MTSAMHHPWKGAAIAGPFTKTKPKKLIGDKAYDSAKLGQQQ